MDVFLASASGAQHTQKVVHRAPNKVCLVPGPSSMPQAEQQHTPLSWQQPFAQAASCTALLHALHRKALQAACCAAQGTGGEPLLVKHCSFPLRGPWSAPAAVHCLPACRPSPHVFHNFDYHAWTPPPYKKHYSANSISFDKPSIIIHNKYAPEW